MDREKTIAEIQVMLGRATEEALRSIYYFILHITA